MKNKQVGRPSQQITSIGQLMKDSLSEQQKPKRKHHRGNPLTNYSKESGSRSQLVVDPYDDERKQWLKRGQMQIKQAEDQIKQLMAKKMEASKEAQVIEQKLRQLEKQYGKVVYQGYAIEVELEDETRKLQKMSLKIQSELNAKQKQRYINKIRQCEGALEYLRQRKVSWQAQIIEITRFINENKALLMKEKYRAFPPINPRKE